MPFSFLHITFVALLAFTHWVNTVLGQRGMSISDLGTDLRTGVLLANFLELLSRKKFTFTRKPAVKIQEIENLSICVKHIQNDCEVRLVGIGAEDIYEGNVKLILGLLWSLFRKFKINTITTDDKSSEEGLLLWVKTTTADYDGVSITNYSDSFRDGLAFMALIDKYTDGDVNYEDYKDEDPENRLQLAFEQLEQRANVPKLLDPEEVRTGFVDERALVLYLSLAFHAFKAKEEADAIEKRKLELAGKVEREQSELTRMQEEKDALSLERDKLNKESLEITAALESKAKSVEELAESNEKFLTQVEGFREQVVEQGKQLKQLRGWVAWERDGLAELRRLKEEREARHKSMLALQVQLKLHAGFMQSMREQSYSALDDAFDDEVRPALLKRLSKAGGIEGEIGVLREALEAEAKRVAYERKCVQRLHKDAIKAGKSGAKTKDAAKDTKDAKDKASAGSAVAKKKKEAKKEEEPAVVEEPKKKEKKPKEEANEEDSKKKEKKPKEEATEEEPKKKDKKNKEKKEETAAPAVVEEKKSKKEVEVVKEDKKKKKDDDGAKKKKKDAEGSDSVEEVVVTKKESKKDKKEKEEKRTDKEDKKKSKK